MALVWERPVWRRSDQPGLTTVTALPSLRCCSLLLVSDLILSSHCDTPQAMRDSP